MTREHEGPLEGVGYEDGGPQCGACADTGMMETHAAAQRCPAKGCRARIALEASDAARLGRRPGPTLDRKAETSRWRLIEWLVWNDPNGCYTDDDCAAEGIEALTVDAAWELIGEQVDA